MKSGIVLTIALAIVLVFALGAVALAVPSGGANGNVLGQYRSDNAAGDYDKPAVFGEAQSAWVHEINEGGTSWTNYGEFLNWWKADMGFKS
ncbi:MAG TPA: hypothetical protein VFC03_08830 [Acidimicrobiales bacterium]|nr:hypothetical protein [Acidimicrobiales bacterium]